MRRCGPLSCVLRAAQPCRFPGADQFPAFQANQLNFNTRALFTDAIAEDTRPAGQPSAAESVRETVSRWLNNPGWGWEDYVATRTRYVIDIAQLHDKFMQHIDQFCEQIRKALTAQVDVSVTAGMATFFAEFSLCLAGLQESLRDSLAVRQQNEHSTRSAQPAVETKYHDCDVDSGRYPTVTR